MDTCDFLFILNIEGPSSLTFNVMPILRSACLNAPSSLNGTPKRCWVGCSLGDDYSPTFLVPQLNFSPTLPLSRSNSDKVAASIEYALPPLLPEVVTVFPVPTFVTVNDSIVPKSVI